MHLQMRCMLFLVLIGCELTTATFYDVRCGDNDVWEKFGSNSSEELSRKLLRSLRIKEPDYENTKIVICNKGNVQPDFQEADNWTEMLDRLELVMEKFGLNCHNFPQVVENMNTYLMNEDSYFNNDCDWVVSFCSECNGCPGVDEKAGTNRSNTLWWASQEETSICMYNFVHENLRQAMIFNASWYWELRLPCEECYGDQCNSEAAKVLHTKLMSELEGDVAHWQRLCYGSSIMGAMNALHLRDRFELNDYWTQQMQVFGHYQMMSDLFHACWVTSLLVLLYAWQRNCCNPFRVAQKLADLGDPVMAYLVGRLALGKTRKNRTRRPQWKKRGMKRRNRKAGVKKTKGKKRRTKAKKSKKVDAPIKMVLPNGKEILQKRGPCGRGGFGGRGRGRRGRGAAQGSK